MFLHVQITKVIDTGFLFGKSSQSVAESVENYLIKIVFGQTF